MPKTPWPQDLRHLQSITPLIKRLRWGSVFLLLLLIGWLPGCVDHYAENKELLSKDYQSLSNEE